MPDDRVILVYPGSRHYGEVGSWVICKAVRSMPRTAHCLDVEINGEGKTPAEDLVLTVLTLWQSTIDKAGAARQKINDEEWLEGL